MKTTNDLMEWFTLLYGDKDPVDGIYDSLMNTKSLLPERFIIQDEMDIEVKGLNDQLFLIDSLLKVYINKEEYIKCANLEEIRKIIEPNLES